MKRIFLFLLLSFLLGTGSGRLYAQKMIDRDSFSLKYPDSWEIDTKDEDYDPDALFSLDAPDDNGMVMIIILDMVVDLDDMLKEQDSDIRDRLMKKPTSVTNFSKWGNYTGKGKTYKGKIMGVIEGEVNVFVCHIGEHTFYVMEQLFEEKMEEVRSGIKMISSSFRFKGRK
jgi:hypothetical protein